MRVHRKTHFFLGIRGRAQGSAGKGRQGQERAGQGAKVRAFNEGLLAGMESASCITVEQFLGVGVAFDPPLPPHLAISRSHRWDNGPRETSVHYIERIESLWSAA